MAGLNCGGWQYNKRNSTANIIDSQFLFCFVLCFIIIDSQLYYDSGADCL